MAEDMRLLLDADQILARWLVDANEEHSIRDLVQGTWPPAEWCRQANLPEMAQLSGRLGLLHELALAALPRRRPPTWNTYCPPTNSSWIWWTRWRRPKSAGNSHRAAGGPRRVKCPAERHARRPAYEC